MQVAIEADHGVFEQLLEWDVLVVVLANDVRDKFVELQNAQNQHRVEGRKEATTWCAIPSS